MNRNDCFRHYLSTHEDRTTVFVTGKAAHVCFGGRVQTNSTVLIQNFEKIQWDFGRKLCNSTQSNSRPWYRAYICEIRLKAANSYSKGWCHVRDRYYLKHCGITEVGCRPYLEIYSLDLVKWRGLAMFPVLRRREDKAAWTESNLLIAITVRHNRAEAKGFAYMQ